jgi:hypothetical protein
MADPRSALSSSSAGTAGDSRRNGRTATGPKETLVDRGCQWVVGGLDGWSGVKVEKRGREEKRWSEAVTNMERGGEVAEPSLMGMLG